MQQWRQWLILCVPWQTYDPAIEISSSVDEAHLAFPLADVLNEVTHDVRKEGYSTKHDHNGYNHLKVTDGKDVSVTYGSKGCDCKVAWFYHLMLLTFLVLQKHVIPCSFWIELSWLWVQLVGDVEPSAPKEVGDEDSNENKSQYFVHVHNEILLDDLLVVSCISIDTFN